MPTFQSPVDSTTLFYRVYTPSSSPFNCSPEHENKHQPLTLVFLHGWPMSSRMFDALILPLVETHRFRVVAPDKRGFGRSDWTSSLSSPEVTMDTFADDLVGLLEHLQPALGPFVFVAASMGSGESLLARTKSSSVKANCRGFVWIGPNLPYGDGRDPSTGEGVDPAVWSWLVEGFRGPRSKEFIGEQVPGVFRADLQPDDKRIGDRTLRFFERLVCEADPVALERTAVVLQRGMVTELEDLGAGDGEGPGGKVPVLILHGDSDAGMPLEYSAAVIHRMVPWSVLKVYERSGHGIYLTHAQQVIDDIMEFLQPLLEQEERAVCGI